MDRVDQRHIARFLNISQATVSRALHGGPVAEATRQRVLDACRQLGYEVHYTAQSLASGRTQNLVYAVESFRDLRGENTHNQLVGAGEVAFEYTYTLSIDLIDRVPRLAAAGYMDGVLISLHARDRHEETFEWVRHTQFPVVLLDAPIDEPGVANIRVDDWEAGYTLTRHVLDAGHRDVVFFGLAERSAICRARHEGFLAAVQARSDVKQRSVCIDNWIGRPEEVLALREHVEALAPRPTAFVASSDACAAGLIALLGELGAVVPDEVSVVGFGDSRWSRCLTPPLTTVDLKGHEVGRAAMAALLRLVAGGRRRAARKIAPKLVARRSCVPPA